MSLSDEISEELCASDINKTCCRKAFLCGLLYSCVATGNKGEYAAYLYRECDAKRAAKIIDTHFSNGTQTEIIPAFRGGHRAYMLHIRSKALINVFSDIDSGKAQNIFSAVGFRCAECTRYFLCGVFVSCATLADQKNGYHLEFSVRGDRRATLLADLLGESVTAPGRIKRGERIGLYYKSNSKIADLLYFIGASKASFIMANISIERDIRNNENRATNCVTRNLQRSVGASGKQIEAINYIFGINKDSALSKELEYTARLKLENDSATLAELARLHEPPISKSGLNARLTKIMAIAEELRSERVDNNENRK